MRWGEKSKNDLDHQGIVLNINVAMWWYCAAIKLTDVVDDDDNDESIEDGKMKIENRRRMSEQMDEWYKTHAAVAWWESIHQKANTNQPIRGENQHALIHKDNTHTANSSSRWTKDFKKFFLPFCVHVFVFVYMCSSAFVSLHYSVPGLCCVVLRLQCLCAFSPRYSDAGAQMKLEMLQRKRQGMHCPSYNIFPKINNMLLIFIFAHLFAGWIGRW